MSGLDDATAEFVRLLERLGFPYAIMGGLAVRIHALPRPTFDVEFTAAIPRESLPDLYQAIAQLGFAVPAAQLTGWIDSVRGLPVVKFQWPIDERAIDVDVFLAETPFQRELLVRRKRRKADGFEAWFVTAENLILLKLLADRQKDRTDVADILFIQRNLDEEHLRIWAARLGIADALEAALENGRE